MQGKHIKASGFQNQVKKFEDYRARGAKIREHINWIKDGDATTKFYFLCLKRAYFEKGSSS